MGKFGLKPDENEESQDEKAQALGWRVHFLEVTVMGYFLGYAMNAMVMLQFTYSRIIDDVLKKHNVTLNKTDSNSHCSANVINSTSAIVTEEAQGISSSWQLYLSLAGGIPSIFAAIILGSYSDRIGRKVLFILPTVGALLRTIVYCLVSYFHLPLFCLAIVHGIEGATGSFVTVLLASFAYTSDITGRGKKRSFQITVMESMLGIGLGVANLSLGFMIKAWGFTLPNIPIVAILTCTTLIAGFLLPETRVKDPTSQRPSFGQAIYRVYRFYLSKDNGNPRDCFLVCGAIFITGAMAFVGSVGVETLYVLNEPLCWSSVQIGYYMATKALSQSLAAVVVVKLLQCCLPDIRIAMVAGLSKIAAVVLEGFATTDAYMYSVAVVGMAGIALLAMTRSIMSKLTQKDQQGAMFASIASVEAIANMTASIAFAAIYQQTLVFYDGTVFFVIGFMLLISLSLYVVLHFKLKRRERELLEIDDSLIVNTERGPLLGYRGPR